MPGRSVGLEWSTELGREVRKFRVSRVLTIVINLDFFSDGIK